MRAVVQRVSRAEVRVGGEVVGRIGRGLAVLLGVGHGDTEEEARYLVEKISGLRIFPDEEGKMNLGLEETRGALLVVSMSVEGDGVAKSVARLKSLLWGGNQRSHGEVAGRVRTAGFETIVPARRRPDLQTAVFRRQ